MFNIFRRGAFSGAILLAVVAPLQAYALDGATRSVPSATAPSSDGARASGGVSNGMGDSKNNRAALLNGSKKDAPPIGDAIAEDAESSPSQAAGSGQPGQPGQPNQAGHLIQADQLAIRELAQVHLFETKLAGLATAISGNPTVRAYAVKMLADHLNALDTLRGIAARGGVTLPGGVESSQAAELHGLVLKTGADFDTSYLNDAGPVLKHQEMALFQRLAKSVQSDSLKRYTLAQMQLANRHLQLAEKMTASPQGGNAIEAAPIAGQSVSAAAPVNTASNRKQGNSGAPGASSVAGSAVPQAK